MNMEVLNNNESGSIRDMLSDMDLYCINFYKKSKKVEIKAVSKKLVNATDILKHQKELQALFNTDNIILDIRFDIDISLEEKLKKYMDSIIILASQSIPSARVLLKDCKWELNERLLQVNIESSAAALLELKGCNCLMEDIVYRLFSENIRVVFISPEKTEGIIKDYICKKQKEEIKRTEEYPAVIENNSNYTMEVKAKNNAVKEYNIIKGKRFKDAYSKMSELLNTTGIVAVKGEIYNIQYKEISKKMTICTFDITDYSSSWTVKFFEKNDDINKKKDLLKENLYAGVKGELQYDSYSKDTIIKASDIICLERVYRTDNAEKKRVELHLHTQMSAMDGVTPVKDLVERAAQWGHKALAITDHGVVQAFPDAYEAGKKAGIKIIYGMECYLLDDNVPIVYNSYNIKDENDIVVVDIETTGLKPEINKITEIGLVRIKDGVITDEYCTLVNPGVPIPQKITELTGINDEMVATAPLFEDITEKISSFIGNSIIVAHNAMFDTGFIRHEMARHNKDLKNPVVDTLEMSRRLFPDLKRHKLDSVARHIGISQKEHHRALDDAKTAALIFIHCFNLFKVKGIDSIRNIDTDKQFNETTGRKKGHSYHCVIFAKNMKGLHNLYRIVSESHIEYFYKKPRVPKKLLTDYREGLLLTTACEAGEVFTAFLEGRNERDIERIVDFYDFLEIQPLGNNRFLIDNGKISNIEALKEINRKIVELGNRTGKPVIATCDVHFLDPEGEVYRRILMTGQGYDDADRQAPLFFRTTSEMLEEFDYLGSEKAYEIVVANTNAVCDMVEELKPIPEGTFPPKIEGSGDQLKEITYKRATDIYGENLPQIVRERLDKELNSIIKNQFSVMYIIARKLVAKSLEDGYLVGSRGSVGSSFVAYLANITEVNSLPPHYICKNCKYSEFYTDGSVECGIDLTEKACPNCSGSLQKDGYDIPFETFLGFDGDKEPDIDLNFSGDYQNTAHKYTEVLFGKGQVYRAGTISTLADKTAYGYVKKYMEEKAKIVTNAEINRLTKGCTGIKKTTGQHPGGIMIVPQGMDIHSFCPVQRPADDMKSDVVTTHFDYHSISGRLLKLDILGHDDPTMIKMLEDLTGVDATKIPLDEKNTMKIFSSTQPLGISPEDIDSPVGTFAIPEFGTKFVRQMLIEAKPSTFSELIRISGLSHGTDVWSNNAQELVRNGTAVLSEVICTRDDIMIYLIHSGLESKMAFKIMEDVRKGKGLKEEYEKAMKEHGVPGWYIESCKKIKYMFPKAHAAAYVMMAFRIAWFKVYYPEAFYTSYFTVRADDFDAQIMTKGADRVKSKIMELESKIRDNTISQKEKAMLTILEVSSEMYARGIKFLPVDIYKSDAKKFIITSEGIRPPFNSLQGLGEAAANNIVKARENGIFVSIEDLRMKSGISKAVIDILKNSGCLNDMHESSQLSLF